MPYGRQSRKWWISVGRVFDRYSVDDICKLRADRLALNDAILRCEPIIAQAARSLGFFKESHNHEGMEIEDALQAGRIGIWKGIYKFDPDKTGKNKTLGAFLYTMARQEILDEIRRCRWMPNRRRSGPSRVVYWDDWEFFSPMDNPTLSHVETEEELSRVEGFVEGMNVSHRNVYQAVLRHESFDSDRHGEGARYARTAGIREPRVCQIKKQIRNNLKTAFH